VEFFTAALNIPSHKAGSRPTSVSSLTLINNSTATVKRNNNIRHPHWPASSTFKPERRNGLALTQERSPCRDGKASTTYIFKQREITSPFALTSFLKQWCMSLVQNKLKRPGYTHLKDYWEHLFNFSLMQLSTPVFPNPVPGGTPTLRVFFVSLIKHTW